MNNTLNIPPPFHPAQVLPLPYDWHEGNVRVDLVPVGLVPAQAGEHGVGAQTDQRSAAHRHYGTRGTNGDSNATSTVLNAF